MSDSSFVSAQGGTGVNAGGFGGSGGRIFFNAIAQNQQLIGDDGRKSTKNLLDYEDQFYFNGGGSLNCKKG